MENTNKKLAVGRVLRHQLGRRGWVSFAVVLMIFIMCHRRAGAAEPRTIVVVPAVKPVANSPARQAERWKIWHEKRMLDYELQRQLGPGQQALRSATSRRRVAAKAIPITLRAYKLNLRLLKISSPQQRPYVHFLLREDLVILSVLGDAKAKAELDADAQSANPAKATNGRVALLLYHLYLVWHHEKEVLAILREFEKLARVHPTNANISSTLWAISNSPPRLPALAERRFARRLLLKVMPNTLAARMLVQDKAARQKLLAMVGKPMNLQTRSLTGDRLNTTRWRGRVLVVCVWFRLNQLVAMQPFYNKYHARGLSMIGVPMWQNFEQIGQTMMTHPHLSWRQTRIIHKVPSDGLLLGAIPFVNVGNQWHDYEIICDRRGIVRFVVFHGSGGMPNAEIKKLLANRQH